MRTETPIWFRWFTIVALCALLALMMVGCGSSRTVTKVERIEVPVVMHDTVSRVIATHDTTVIDRWHTQEQHGDTVIVTNEVTRTVTKVIRDTTFVKAETAVTASEKSTEVTSKRRSMSAIKFIAIAIIIAMVYFIYVKLKKIKNEI